METETGEKEILHKEEFPIWIQSVIKPELLAKTTKRCPKVSFINFMLYFAMNQIFYSKLTYIIGCLKFQLIRYKCYATYYDNLEKAALNDSKSFYSNITIRQMLVLENIFNKNMIIFKLMINE